MNHTLISNKMIFWSDTNLPNILLNYIINHLLSFTALSKEEREQRDLEQMPSTRRGETEGSTSRRGLGDEMGGSADGEKK